MIIKGEQFVVKKLVDMGNGCRSVALPEPVHLLSTDLVWLMWMDYVAKAFFAWGEQERAELTCSVVIITH